MAKPHAQQPASVRLASSLTAGILFLLPLIYLPDISYTALRYVLFGAVCLALGLATAWTWLRAPEIPRSFFRSWLSYGVLAYLGAFLLASIFSVDAAASFWSSFQRTDGAFTMILVTIFALNVFTLLAVRGKDFVYSLFKPSVIGAACLSVLIMMYTYHTEGTWFEVSRGGATVGNSSLAASYVLWNIFFAAAIILKENSKRRKLTWLLPALIMLASPLFLNWQFKLAQGLTDALGAARGATLGIIFGALVAIASWLTWQSGPGKRSAGKTLLALMLLLTLFAGSQLFRSNSKLHHAFDSVVGENRFIFWDIGIKAFRDHPVLGWGPYTFSVPYQLYYEPKMIALPYPELWVDHAHNLFVETLATGGIALTAGLLLFLASIAFAIIHSRKYGRLADWEAALLAGALAGWLLQAQFVFESIVSLTMLFLIAGAAYAAALRAEPIKNFGKIYSAGKKSVFAGFAAVSAVLFVYAVALPYGKDRLMYHAYNSKLPQRAELWAGFSRVSPMGTGFDTAIIFNNMESEYEQNIDAVRKESPERKKVIAQELNNIASYLYGQAAEKKYGFEPALLGAKFYYLLMSADNDFHGEAFDRGMELSDKALRLSPNNPESYWIKAKIQFAAKNYPDAKNLLEEALKLEPAAKQTNQLILALAQATKDQAYYDFALQRAKQNIPNF